MYRAGEVVANLLILNVLWLLASLPVVTAFPATAALFGVVRAWQRSGDAPIARTFAEQFKRNFAQSALLSAPWLLVGLSIGAAFVVVGHPEGVGSWLLFAATCVAATAFAFTSVYLFPVLVHYELGIADAARYALLLSIGAAPTTMLCALSVAVVALLTAAVPILGLWSGGAVAYGVYWLCERTFPRAPDPGSQRLDGTEAAPYDADRAV